MPDFKRNIRRAFKNREPFWGKYEPLNSVQVPSLDIIQQYQLTKIKMFQQAAINMANEKTKMLNGLFLSGAVNKMPGIYETESNHTLQKVISDLVGMINGEYKYNKTKEQGYNYEKLQTSLGYLKNAIIKLNAILSSTGEERTIPGAYLDAVNEAMAACNITSLNPSVLDDWFKQLNNFKGALVEDIGVQWLEALKIPDMMTINTGSVSLQGGNGGLSEGRHRGQLIQDLMMIDMSIPDVMNIPIEYKAVGSNKYVKGTLKSFLDAMDKANKQSKQVSISDEGYSALLELSALNIQSKAGINQKPWNENKSTSVSLSEFAQDNLVISAKHTFELLHELDLDNNPEKDIWVEDTSKDYNMIADYGLATVLFKILHLDREGNQFLLTPQGFTTYTDRMTTLMEKRRSRVYLKGNVTIDNNTMSNTYSVGMTNYN